MQANVSSGGGTGITCDEFLDFFSQMKQSMTCSREEAVQILQKHPGHRSKDEISRLANHL